MKLCTAVVLAMVFMASHRATANSTESPQFACGTVIVRQFTSNISSFSEDDLSKIKSSLEDKGFKVIGSTLEEVGRQKESDYELLISTLKSAHSTLFSELTGIAAFDRHLRITTVGLEVYGAHSTIADFSPGYDYRGVPGSKKRSLQVIIEKILKMEPCLPHNP